MGYCHTGAVSRVMVVGAGVVGLTCAVRLLEAGHRVDVVARDLPRETTSAVAPALCYPQLLFPPDRVAGWTARTFEVLADLAADETSGVRMLPGTEVLTQPQVRPWWGAALPGLERATDLPEGYVDGWTCTAPVVEMPVHLDWLRARMLALGGTLTRLHLRALPTGGDVVVNCSGLGSRLLAPDLSLTPVRGQVVVVEQVGLDRWWLDPASPSYVVPRSGEVVVGGTEEDGEWSRTPSAATAEAILARAARLVPELAGARVLRHQAGLRPARPTVRLERAGRVVHCYGHGGAGVTLAWGCADDVVRLI